MPARKKPVLVEPEKLGPGGRALWDETVEAHELTPQQKVLLMEACRAKDKLDKIEDGLAGLDSIIETVEREDGAPIEVIVNAAATTAKNQAELMAKMLASMQLGRNNARAGVPGIRAPYDGRRKGKGTGRPVAVSSLERARRRATGA